MSASSLQAAVSNTFAPGPAPGTVRTPGGEVLKAPQGWILVLPGDPALTRRIKAAGPHWVVQERRGRKVFSRGIWTDEAIVLKIQHALEAERSTESHARKLAAGARRREKIQTAYVEDFHGAVLNFLGFAPAWTELAEQLASVVTAHTTPVGSGTVARTQRIPVERRAEAAVIAWMRHQTTAYDSMNIPRVKGARREVRRMLAQRSREMLACYRSAKETPPADCPLREALLRGPIHSTLDLAEDE